jgi:hypothetical protein
VSIKNKLVTAVTTAGLLAGLFGSAFVPAARAAAVAGTATNNVASVCYENATATSPGFEGTAVDGGGVTQHYAVVSKNIQFSFCQVGTAAGATLPDSNAAITVTVTVTGGTIVSYVPGAAASAYVIAPAATSMTFLTDADATVAEIAAVKVNVKAGSTAGGTLKVSYTYNNDAGTAVSTTVSSVSIKLIAASRLKATLPVQTGGSTVAITGADADPATPNITENATTLNWSDTHDSTGSFVFVPKNDYGTGIAGELVTVSSSNDDILNVHMAATSTGTLVSANAAGTYTVATTNTTGNIIGVYPTQDASGTATLTIAVDGVVVWTKTFTVVGPVATITPTASINYVALGASLTGTSTTKLASIAAKDASGNAVTVASYDYYVDGFLASSVNDDSGNGATAYAGFTNALCASSATAGSTRSIVAKSTYADALGDDVTVASAAWTITCTGTSGIITKVEFDKAAYLPSSAIKITATATDSGGRPLGYGATAIESGAEAAATTDEFTIVKQGTITLGDVDSTGTTTEGITFGGVLLGKWVNGVAEWAAVSHSAVGDFGLVLTVADNDPATTGAQAKEFTLVATVSNILSSVVDGTLVAGPKKLKATATFGAAAANKKIAFTLENTRTGVVKTYYRKANASGVASFTLRFSGSFEVTAAYGDYMTDTVTLKK